MNVKGRLRGKSPLGGLFADCSRLFQIHLTVSASLLQAESVFVRWKVFKHIDIKNWYMFK